MNTKSEPSSKEEEILLEPQNFSCVTKQTSQRERSGDVKTNGNHELTKDNFVNNRGLPDGSHRIE